MKIKYVLLDLGGVAFGSTGVSNVKINWSVISKLNHKYGHGLNIGEDLFGTFLQEYNQSTNQKLSGADFLEAVFDTLEFNQELVEFLQKKYQIIIVSDNYRENIEYISQRYHFSSWAVQQFYSFDLELEKGDKEFFKLLLEKIKIPTDELIFIDDSKHKIESAARWGIKGIIFQNTTQVKSAIEELEQ